MNEGERIKPLRIENSDIDSFEALTKRKEDLSADLKKLEAQRDGFIDNQSDSVIGGQQALRRKNSEDIGTKISELERKIKGIEDALADRTRLDFGK
jgi:hypothetical protein